MRNTVCIYVSVANGMPVNQSLTTDTRYIRDKFLDYSI